MNDNKIKIIPLDPLPNLPEGMVGGMLTESITISKGDVLQLQYRKPGETLTAWADRLRIQTSPQAKDAE